MMQEWQLHPAASGWYQAPNSKSGGGSGGQAARHAAPCQLALTVRSSKAMDRMEVARILDPGISVHSTATCEESGWQFRQGRKARKGRGIMRGIQPCICSRSNRHTHTPLPGVSPAALKGTPAPHQSTSVAAAGWRTEGMPRAG